MQTQLVTRVTAKTGTIDNANLTAQKRHRDDAHQHGGLRAMAIDATSGLNVTWNKSGGTGETDFQNFPGLGTGGFAFYNNNSKLGSLDASGNLSITGNLTLGTNGTVGGRRPAFTATANCATSSCTASCAPGVIKFALGFHGTNFDTQVNQSAWGCGTAISWMGSCIGAQSCTISTSCTSSAVFAECW